MFDCFFYLVLDVVWIDNDCVCFRDIKYWLVVFWICYGWWCKWCLDFLKDYVVVIEIYYVVYFSDVIDWGFVDVWYFVFID